MSSYAVKVNKLGDMVVSTTVSRFRSESARDSYIAWSNGRGYDMQACTEEYARKLWETGKAANEGLAWQQNYMLNGKKLDNVYFTVPA